MSALKQTQQFTNTNQWNTKQLVTMALMCAIGVALTFIEIPIFPAAPWLKYDPAAVPALICGFAFGPASGIAVGFIGAVAHGLLFGDVPGAFMNILVTVGCVLPSALIYKRIHTLKGAFLGLATGIICSIALAVLGNLLVTPTFYGMPLDAVIAMIIPILLPFNALKAVLNAALTLVIYKSISNLITPKTSAASKTQASNVDPLP